MAAGSKYDIGTSSMLEKERRQNAQGSFFQRIPDAVYLATIAAWMIGFGVYGIITHQIEKETYLQDRQAAIQEIKEDCVAQKGIILHVPSSESPWVCLREGFLIFKSKGPKI